MTGRTVGAEGTFVDVMLLVAADAICGDLGSDGLRRVTGFAGQTAMCASQIECRFDVVIKSPKGPAIWRVAGAADRTQRALVDIVRRMATCAVDLGDLKALILVTAFAQRRRVQTDQREICQVMVEPDLTSPSLDLVAICAIMSKRTFVRIIPIMASRTVCRRLGRRGGPHARLMTLCAGHFGMWTDKGEFGVAIVVEIDLFPAGFLMAVGAVLPHRATMNIVQRMAADASDGHTLPYLRAVARQAANLGMVTFQGKTGLGMVKGPHFHPFRGNVARRAIATQPALVRVVFAVTIDAGAWRFGKALARGVAPLTGHGHVARIQRKIGLAVVKGLPVQSDDLGVAALVIGMTIRTGQGSNLSRTAVVTGLVRDIQRHRLVTIQAPLRLGPLIKGFVAGIAGLFELRVDRRKLAGHDQLLEQRLGGRPGWLSGPEKAKAMRPRALPVRACVEFPRFRGG